jgi:dATP/dGTP diphosphohydrolase, N-terminal
LGARSPEHRSATRLWSRLPVHTRAQCGSDRAAHPELVLAIARVLTFGAMKYGDRDWERVIAWGRVFGTVQRYLWAWWGGEDTDPEMGYSHLLRRAGSRCGVRGCQDGIVSCSGSWP